MGPDLQGFYSVPDCEICFSLFIPRAAEKKKIDYFSYFLSVLCCLPVPLLYNCVLQLRQMTVFIFCNTCCC